MRVAGFSALSARARGPASTERLLLQLAGLSGPLALVHCAEIRELMATLMPAWPASVCDDTERAEEPVITVLRDAHGYLLATRRSAKQHRYGDPVNLTCALIAELFWPLLEANHDLLCLHGAAVEFAGRLVVFPNRYRAGKSLLSAALAATGRRLFTDDVLPLAGPSDRGLAMGVRPRLRLPLPETLDADTKRFIDERAGPASDRYLYLETTQAEQAPHGTQATIGAFVLLERNASEKPTITPISFGTVMRQLVWQNFARHLHHADIMRRLHTLSERALCFRLSYSRVDQAVALLDETFDSWPSSAPRNDAVRALSVDSIHYFDAPAPASRIYARHPGVVESRADGEHFLSNPDGTAIHHLNALGSAVWQLLVNDVSAAEIIETVHCAYPHVQRAQIAADVGKLIATLVDSGLVIEA